MSFNFGKRHKKSRSGRKRSGRKSSGRKRVSRKRSGRKRVSRKRSGRKRASAAQKKARALFTKRQKLVREMMLNGVSRKEAWRKVARSSNSMQFGVNKIPGF